MDEDQRLLTPADVAEYLGVPKGTIYRWRVRGEGPRALRIGKYLRYEADEVRGWARQRSEDSTRSGGVAT
jgi:excisionase family DNA binding protein